MENPFYHIRWAPLSVTIFITHLCILHNGSYANDYWANFWGYKTQWHTLWKVPFHYPLIWLPQFLPVQVSPVTTRRLGSTNLIRDIRGTRTNEFRKKKLKKKKKKFFFFFFFFLILEAKAETSYSGPGNLHTLVSSLQCILCFQRITFFKNKVSVGGVFCFQGRFWGYLNSNNTDS